MILDGLLLFDNAVAITVTRVSTNQLDLLNARDMGIGDSPSLKVRVLVTTPLVSGGATTLQVQFQGSTDNVTYTTYAESAAIAKAALVQGAHVFDIDVPRTQPGGALPRYLQLNYVVATGPFTAGAVTAGIVLGPDDNISYPPGVVIAN